jgi:hypothetical protein
MADIMLKFSPGQGFTCTASAPVTGGQLVELTGARRVGPAGAASLKVLGVAMRDAVAEAELPVEVQGVVALTASGAIAAGDRVQAAAAGAVAVLGGTPADGQTVGLALEAISNGLKGLVLLTRA